MPFSSFGLCEPLNTNVKRAGYETPTPIQLEAIPKVMSGRDVLGLAQTGTGKTAAFLLPMLNHLLASKVGATPHKPRALIVAPTRELASQIHDHAMNFCRGTNLRSALIFGGVAMNPQFRALRGGAQIVVACPGRLLDHVDRGSVNLSNVEIVVLDEADHMFDMGFLPPIRRILSLVPAKRQTLLFSATMPPEISSLANDVLTNPESITVGHLAPPTLVEQAATISPHDSKIDVLLDLLSRVDGGSTLVFTRTKHRAKGLADKVVRAGFPAASIQGNLSQNQRQAALAGFRAGRIKVLVATDIAARGIDVANIAQVINFDLPDTAENYTHRIGRTGRAMCTGMAHSLVAPDEIGHLKRLERHLGQAMTRHEAAGHEGIIERTRAANIAEREQNEYRRRGARPPFAGRSFKPRGASDRPWQSASPRPHGDGQGERRFDGPRPRLESLRPRTEGAGDNRAAAAEPRGERHSFGAPRVAAHGHDAHRPAAAKPHGQRSETRQPRADSAPRDGRYFASSERRSEAPAPRASTDGYAKRRP